MTSKLWIGLLVLGFVTSMPLPQESKAPKDDEGLVPMTNILVPI